MEGPAVKIPDWLQYDFWRLVDAGLGTLPEICEQWTLRAFIEAHEFLNLKDEAERKARETK